MATGEQLAGLLAHELTLTFDMVRKVPVTHTAMARLWLQRARRLKATPLAEAEAEAETEAATGTLSKAETEKETEKIGLLKRSRLLSNQNRGPRFQFAPNTLLFNFSLPVCSSSRLCDRLIARCQRRQYCKLALPALTWPACLLA